MDKLKSIVVRLLASSERLFSLLVVVILFGIAAILGTPGDFPTTADGSYLTPDAVANLLAPIGLVFATFWSLLKSIDARVASGNIQPNDIIALLKVNDFWVAMIGIAAGIFHVFGADLLQDEGTQAAAVNAIMALVTLFLRDYATRPSGEKVLTAHSVLREAPHG